MTLPAIDLVLPFYGAPEQLRETVQSVLAQTRGDWRLTVVDDAWPGEPVGPWLEGLGDPRVRYLRNETNLGINGNFRRCLALAEAPYVAFPGGDDLLLPTYVEVVLAAADRTGATLIQPGVAVIDAAGHRVVPLADRVKSWIAPRADDDVLLDGAALLRSLGTGNWLYFPSLAWRTADAAAIGFRAGLETALDLQLIVDLAFRSDFTCALVPGETFLYRRHAASYSSLSARAVDRFDEEATVLDDAVARSRERGWLAAARTTALRPTHRMHAALMLPGADSAERRRLVRRVLARRR